MIQSPETFKPSWRNRQIDLRNSSINHMYLYAHIEADTGNVFYIGIGETAERPWDMSMRSKDHKQRVKEHGVIVNLLSDSIYSRRLAVWWECWWIAACKTAGFDLVNKSPGGTGATKEKAKEAANRPEVKQLKSKIRKEFLESEEGILWRKTQSSQKQEFANSEAGKVAAFEHSKKLKQYFKTDKGLAQAEKQSENAKIQCRGSSNPNSKIDETIAQAVLDAEGTRSEIAKRFGLTYNIVSSIKSRRKWKHLTPTEV